MHNRNWSRAFLSLILASSFSTLEAKGPSRKNVALQLKILPAKSLLADDTFEVTLLNISKSNIYIYKDLAYGLTIHIFDSKGRAIQPKVIGDLCPPPPPVQGELPFVAIAPGKSVSVVYERSFDDLGITEPGNYQAAAAYYYSLNKGPNDKYPSFVRHPITSDKIQFTFK